MAMMISWYMETYQLLSLQPFTPSKNRNDFHVAQIKWHKQDVAPFFLTKICHILLAWCFNCPAFLVNLFVLNLCQMYIHFGI